MVVDDTPANLHLLKRILVQEGYAVRAVPDGAMALTAAAARAPELILLDINMPDMDGYEVARALKDEPRTRQIPILFISAQNELPSKMKAFDSGGVDYITKPFEEQEVLVRVRTHLDLARLRRELETMVEERTHDLLEMNAAMQNFVPRDFLKLLKKDTISDVRLGDVVEGEMTILFADIRDFTAISEDMTPEENFRFVNSYMGQMGPVIRKHGGFIDKYIGDAIMALFPDPGDSVRAAVEMLRLLPEYNQSRADAGRQELKIGIGINTGRTMIGTIGEESRMEGTVISDAVNIAARLEQLTKEYGASIIIGESTRRELDTELNGLCRQLGRVRVKGKQDDISIYEVFAGDDDDSRRLKYSTRGQFARALLEYQSGRMDASRAGFAAVLAENPYDQAAVVYALRSGSAE